MEEDRNHLCIIAALAVNVFYLVVSFAFCGKPYFGAVDDYFMARTLEGVFGDSYNVHLTFVNVLYGYLLLPFYHLFPKAGWYYIGEIAEVYVSFSVISFILIKKMGMRWGIVLSLLFTLFFARDFYLTVQFTLCAAILGASGMLLSLYSIGVQQHKKRIVLLGILLMLWSAIMRNAAFLMGLPFFLCALLFQIKSCYTNKRLLMVATLATLVGLYGIDKLNQAHYTAPEYHKYMEFQPPRSVLGDEKNYDKDLLCTELEKQIFSCADYRLLNNWTFYDTEIFAIDTLKRIAQEIEAKTYPVQWATLADNILDQIELSSGKPGFWSFFLFCIILFISKSGKPNYAGIALLVMIALTAYLLYRQRFVYRVEAGLWLYATTLLIPYMGKLRNISVKHFSAIVAMLAIAAISLFAYDGTHVRSVQNGLRWDTALITKSAVPKHKALFDYIHSTPDDYVFLADFATYKRFNYYKKPPYLSEPIGSWKKIVPLGYWTTYFPDIETHLHKNGISNPIHDIIKSNVFVINDSGLVDFLQRHYYDSVGVSVVKKFDNIKVLKYSEIHTAHSAEPDSL